MKEIKLLDCTLRDGGRIFDCRFPDGDIKEIVRRLEQAKIDMIEIGFLRDEKDVKYEKNSTFFTDVSQMVPFIIKSREDTVFCAFIDYELYDFSRLQPYDGSSVNGLRVGFTKKSFKNEKDTIIKSLKHVKEMGYQLFIQGVNTPGYSDEELLELIDLVNGIEPVGFGIVDTYGTMYEEDLQHIFSIVNFNLKENIWIDFHSHNNFQLSFALAQKMINLCHDNRILVIDGTLNGLGKCAGNLNTELIADFLIRKKHLDYEFDVLLDLIDDYLYEYKKKYSWGYSIPALLAGTYKAHPNNVIYLTENMHMMTKDIRNIMSMIDEDTRQSYDYNNIENLYMEYSAQSLDDKMNLERLKAIFKNKEVLVLAPGKSLMTYKEDISKYYGQRENIICAGINFIPETEGSLVFFGNQRKYEKFRRNAEGMVIIPSNINSIDKSDIVMNYYNLINRGYRYFENSTMMFLNLLRRLDVKKISIAGFDGFSAEENNNYIEGTYRNRRYEEEYELLNVDISKMFSEFILTMSGKAQVQLLTPSRYTGQKGILCLDK